MGTKFTYRTRMKPKNRKAKYTLRKSVYVDIKDANMTVRKQVEWKNVRDSTENK